MTLPANDQDAARDEFTARTIIGEAMGYGSLCWEPKPTGVFDSTEAMVGMPQFVERITLALRAARESAIEECARVADAENFAPIGPWGDGARFAVTKIASAIRARRT